MRILESEGLVTVRRGNVGGAVVHRPTARHVAYTLGMVLASTGVTIDQVAAALREDRTGVRGDVRPAARSANARSCPNCAGCTSATSTRSIISSRSSAGRATFHESLVSLCGNGPLIVTAGALESMWSSHEKGWASRIAEDDPVHMSERLAAAAVHEKIIDLIAKGDAEGVRHVAAQHLSHAQRNPTPAHGAIRIDPALVRNHLA